MTADMDRVERVRIFSMTEIDLSDEDAAHIKDWQRLSADEKEALNKLAKLFGNEEKRKSLYNLIEVQSKISDILAVHGHLNWFGRMFLKAGAIAGVFIAIASVWKIWSGK